MNISIHALREEGDALAIRMAMRAGNFYPRPPRGGRRHGRCKERRVYEHFYPRPPRGGRRGCPRLPFRGPRISIHALREEGDRGKRPSFQSQRHFYPRPPRGGRRKPPLRTFRQLLFLSTPSARRATGSCTLTPITPARFLSTPSARRATLFGRGGNVVMNISIHALREEGDEDALDFLFEVLGFLSTPSARRATGRIGGKTETGKFLSTPSARRATY